MKISSPQYLEVLLLSLTCACMVCTSDLMGIISAAVIFKWPIIFLLAYKRSVQILKWTITCVFHSCFWIFYNIQWDAYEYFWLDHFNELTSILIRRWVQATHHRGLLRICRPQVTNIMFLLSESRDEICTLMIRGVQFESLRFIHVTHHHVLIL